ncbi:MAG TPA: hypothetical protein VGJ15_12010 [Pirellulales bacterium]|jgi:hypothetical protein
MWKASVRASRVPSSSPSAVRRGKLFGRRVERLETRCVLSATVTPLPYLTVAPVAASAETTSPVTITSVEQHSAAANFGSSSSADFSHHDANRGFGSAPFGSSSQNRAVSRGNEGSFGFNRESQFDAGSFASSSQWLIVENSYGSRVLIIFVQDRPMDFGPSASAARNDAYFGDLGATSEQQFGEASPARESLSIGPRQIGIASHPLGDFTTQNTTAASTSTVAARGFSWEFTTATSGRSTAMALGNVSTAWALPQTSALLIGTSQAHLQLSDQVAGELNAILNSIASASTPMAAQSTASATASSASGTRNVNETSTLSAGLAANLSRTGLVVETTEGKAALAVIPLDIQAVEKALHAAAKEINRLGAQVNQWLDNNQFAPVVAVATAAALGYGAAVVYVRRRNRHEATKRLDEDSSSWLFARLQTAPSIS